jgi:hypothetical protein
MRRFHLAARPLPMTRPGFARARRSLAVYSRVAASNRTFRRRGTRFPCRLCELAAPQKSSISPRGYVRKILSLMLSREGRVSGRACAPGPHRRSTSMAAHTPSAGPGGSRGIAGGRDRVRNSLYAAAESSLGRGVSPPGMHDKGLGNDWVLLRSPANRGVIAVIQDGWQNQYPMRFRHRPLASPH